MRDKNGRFVKGVRYSRDTEFKKGEHWRDRKPFWNKDWLENEYINKGKSCKQIADEFSVTENAINFWIKKHGIKSRTMSEVRKIKKWGARGEDNPMYGKKGSLNPNWIGGHTPERQAFYSSIEWRRAVSKVNKRDKRTCQRCGKKKKLHIHHIVSFSCKSLRAEVSNLVTLCIDCHHFVHSKKNVNKEFIKERSMS